MEAAAQEPVRRTTRKAIVLVVMALAAALILLVALSYLLALHYPGAVRLDASLNSTAVDQSRTIRVSLSDTNFLPLANEPFASNLRDLNLTSGPCGGTYPMGVALYQGRYTPENISSARSVLVYAPGTYMCPLQTGAVYRLAPFQTVDARVDLVGYWTEGTTTHPGGGVSEGVLHHFTPGEYTLVAGDGWGNVKTLYFQVRGISLQDFSLCPSNCGYPSPYLSGYIYFGGSAPLKSLQLFVNGTDEGVRPYSNGNITNFVMLYKGGFQYPQVLSGDAYVLRFVATFRDNSTATATTVVVAGR